MESMYEIENIIFKQLQDQIELPSFQRSVVWTDEKKKNFINTVLSGSPFGSLLLYKDMNKYLLVDGLQRFSTIRNFLEYPDKYINLGDDCKETINDIVDIIKTKTDLVTNYKTLSNEILLSIKDSFSLEKDTGKMAYDIVSKMPIVLQSNNTELLFSIQKLINQMLLNLTARYNVSELKIPVIIFHGDYDKLPDIFEKLNSNGTKLNKYDIYAAKWSRITFKVDDATLLQLVDKKYEDMINETGVEILNYELGQICKNQEINLFEYCFALGKLLKNECPNILGSQIGTSSDIDSVGFVLLSTILTGSAQKIDSLPKYFLNANASELVNFKNIILKCVKEVNKLLNDYILTVDQKLVSKYIESQMICIIATLFKIKYAYNEHKTLSFVENTKTKNLIQLFNKNMPKRYLFDIISNYWVGSGDSKITDEMAKNLYDNRYITTILKSSWEVILNEWANEQIQKPSKRISPEVKLFLNYIINLTVLKSKYNDKKFNFEYIISRDKFNNKFHGANGLSALGNICFLPQFEVRSKHENTIYEQIDNKSIVYGVNEDILNDFLYPARNELNFVKTNESFTYENYKKFLKGRNNYLINKFLEIIGE